jgi:hypothetical protein
MIAETTTMTTTRLSLSIYTQSNILHNIVCNEPVDVDCFDLMLKSNLLKSRTFNPFTESMGSEANLLKNYKKNINFKLGCASVKYKRSAGIHYGRANPVRGLGLFMIRAPIRHSIAARVGLADFDMANAHPQILKQICSANNIDCTYLTQYCENRDDILHNVMINLNCCRTRAKILFIRLMFGGKLTKCLEADDGWDFDAINPDVLTTDDGSKIKRFCDKFSAEMKLIAIKVNDANPHLVNEITASKEAKGKKDFNLLFSTLSYYLQEFEVRILETIYLYSKEKGYISADNRCVLCADGIMLELSRIGTANIPDEFHAIVFEKLGFNIQFVNKEFSECWSDEFIHEHIQNKPEDDDDEEYTQTLTIADVFDCLKIDKCLKIDDDILKIFHKCADLSVVKLYGDSLLVTLLQMYRPDIIRNDTHWFEFNEKSAIYVQHSNSCFLYPVLTALGSWAIQLMNTKIIMDGVANKNKSHTRIHAFLKGVSSLHTTTHRKNAITAIKDSVFDVHHGDDMNKMMDYLPIEGNEMLNIKTLTVSPRSSDHHFTYSCGKYISELSCEDTDFCKNYFSELFCNRMDTAQIFFDVFKSALLGQPLRYIVMLVGDGRNGKSLLMKVLKKWLTGFMGTISKLVVCDSKGHSNIQTELEKVDKHRIGVANEISSNDSLNNKNVKEITGGDIMSRRLLHATDACFMPTMTIFTPMNTMPKQTNSNDSAIDDRLLPIPFNARFEHDVSIESSVMCKSDIIMSYILKTGVCSTGSFTFTDEMTDLKNQYLADNDTFAQFITSAFVVDSSDKCKGIRRETIALEYMGWLRLHNKPTDELPSATLTKKLSKLGYRNKRTNSVVFISNIKRLSDSVVGE